MRTKRGKLILLAIAVVLGVAFIGSRIAEDRRAAQVSEASIPFLEPPIKFVRVSTNPSAAPVLARSPIPKEAIVPFPSSIDPAEWRKSDRAGRFDAVVLLGPVSEYQALLTHLVSSPDWRLAKLDARGFLFVREPSVPYPVPAPEEVQPQLPGTRRAEWLATMAARLSAVGDQENTRRYLESAGAADPQSAFPDACAGVIAFQQGRWDEALRRSREALKRDPKLIPARQTMVASLVALDRAEEAWADAESLVEDEKDVYTLLLHARTAHAVHAYSREAKSLAAAIHLMQTFGAPVGGLYILLGQAYAKQDLVPQTLRAFENALAQPELTPDQRRDVGEIRDSIARVTGN